MTPGTDGTTTAPWEAVWADVVGQDRAVAQLRAAAAQPVHAYLLVGPQGSGKRAVARTFAAELLGRDALERGGDPARAVRLAADETHPDLAVFEPEGASLRVEDTERITAAASRSPVEGGRKVLLLTEFEKVAEAGPALLKTIEEPPASVVFLILAEEVPNELVPIASRAVRIALGRVPDDAVIDRLLADGVDGDVARRAAGAAAGDLDRARLLTQDASLTVRLDSWHSVPERVDGTGARAAELVDEVIAHIDESQAPLDQRQAGEVAALDEEIEVYGPRPGESKKLQERHKRETRRHRTAELRFGLATMADRWRDELAGPGTDAALAALQAIDDAAEALIRNPNEVLLLQALVSGFQPLAARK